MGVLFPILRRGKVPKELKGTATL
jgi:hypothetical protein